MPGNRLELTSRDGLSSGEMARGVDLLREGGRPGQRFRLFVQQIDKFIRRRAERFVPLMNNPQGPRPKRSRGGVMIQGQLHASM